MTPRGKLQCQQVPLQTPARSWLPFTEPWAAQLQQHFNQFAWLHPFDPSRQEQQCAYTLPSFDCPAFFFDDGIQREQRDASHLRPQDIKLVIALGDSITAGFGMTSGRPPFASVLEYRGKAFSVGGDDNEYTLHNFLDVYSETLGSPEGVTLPLSKGKALNNAVSGSKAQDLDSQVSRLVHQLQRPPYDTVRQAWKLVTLFIGANNVCVLCTPPLTRLPDLADVDVFEHHVRQAVERLRRDVGYAFVNLPALFNVSQVYEASRGNPYCELVMDPNHMVICSCIQADKQQRRAADLVVQGYNSRLKKIAQDYQELGDPTFMVVYQPAFTQFPVGKYKQRYLSGFDCFHPNRCANQVMATVLWNNMFSNTTEKQASYHVNNLSFVCPSAKRAYLQ
ncbi:hypothetical protein DM01DRAFT_1382070 [Hesseltinella vesiculosa]|uniref:Uncharacterized protein n=1 Tax=Hesseltinella vesiculosa TaxID=101127 RepID=A0A1X2GN00_9FUNG|nr:hypothetical protein DM01DRAFT_1382070 [Hesseltinella vesiculosa]